MLLLFDTQFVNFREFAETMNTLSIGFEQGKLKCGPSLNYKTKLSSAGLVYAFYGKDVIQSVLLHRELGKLKPDMLNFYHDRLYKVRTVCSLIIIENAHFYCFSILSKRSMQLIMAYDSMMASRG